jgi:hypothetical protein
LGTKWVLGEGLPEAPMELFVEAGEALVRRAEPPEGEALYRRAEAQVADLRWRDAR